MVLHTNIFNHLELEYLNQLPEVLDAQKQLEVSNIVKFQVQLPETIKQKISDAFGINLSNIANVPFRWIRGDTLPHLDAGVKQFNNTHLVYLTDGEGEFKIGDESFSIEAGSGFTFPEGTYHEVVNTNGSSRLLLGPMSEQGFVVGAPSNIYIRQNAQDIQYSYDQTNWTNIVSWPFTISGGQSVEFVTDITLTDVNSYFVCNGNFITIGSASLKNDGTRPVITVAVENYPGLVQNGTSLDNGFGNVRVFNLVVNGTGYSTAAEGGWVCQKYFGKGASSVYVINCSSIGGTLTSGTTGSGGIVGAFAGNESGANLNIIGCSNSSQINQLGGGIVGGYAGQNSGTVNCERCWSTGYISGVGAGGIFGEYTALSGNVSVSKCYSTGLIANSAGGIFGRYAGQSGTVQAYYCYSTGDADTDAGGIYALGAAPSGGTTTANTCYSSGEITSAGRGIYGPGKGPSASEFFCYVADGSWSDVAANTVFGGNVSVWFTTGVNIPYKIVDFGYTPYTIQVISEDYHVTSYEATFPAGGATSSGIVNAYYKIISGGHPSITINSVTGVMQTTTSTPPGLYTVKVYRLDNGDGSYSHTGFKLTILQPPQPVVGKKVPVQDMSDYIAKKRIDLDTQGTTVINPLKLRAPLFYRYYNPYYDVNFKRNL